jgi:hypothetical protein
MTQPNTGKCFPTYFSLHYQTSENTFPEFTFPGIHFSKKNYFSANKRGLNIKMLYFYMGLFFRNNPAQDVAS